MAKISAKRQITIPIGLCEEAHIKPGDEVEAFIHNGQITLVKKEKLAAKGILKRINLDKNMDDEESLQYTITKRRKGSV